MHFSSPVSLQRRASTMAPRMACELSGAGMMPSVRGEDLGRLKTLDLVKGGSLDQAKFLRQTDHGRHAVITQAAGVNARRHETVSQGVHFHQRGEFAGIAKVIAILAAAHRRAGMRLAGHKARAPGLPGVSARPASLWRRKGNIRPGKLLPPPTHPITMSG